MRKIAVINGLRGLAICAVVFHHAFFQYTLYGKQAVDFPRRVLDSFLSSGWLGVNVFFLLSGFVLYWPYACGSRAIGGQAGILDFYRRRAHRLLPLYWFAGLISLVFATNIQFRDAAFTQWAALLATATFQFSSANFMPAPNWVLWSIGVEISFSLLFPLLVLAIDRYGWQRVLLVVLVASVATRAIGQALYYPAARGGVLNVVSDSALGRLDEFMLGMFLAHIIAGPASKHVFSGPRALLGVVAMLLSAYGWGAWYRLEAPPWLAALLSWPLDGGLFFVIGYLVTGRMGASSRARSLVEAWPLQMLGLMCYSVYVWHGILMNRFPGFRDSSAEFLAYLGVVLAISAFSYRFIEFGRVSDTRALLPVSRQEGSLDGAAPSRPDDR